MAATIGPDMPMAMEHASAVSSQDLLMTDGALTITEQQQSTLRSNPPPIPHFVFPARAVSATLTSSAPSSFSRASGRRPKSMINPITPVLAGADADRRQRSPALPEFVFNPGAASSSSPVSDGDPNAQPRSPALPDFKFNPGAGLSSPALEHAFLSPPQSPAQLPSSPRAIPARPTGNGHKRGGSEFVGGQIRNGDVINVLSSSPTKSESGFPSPMLKPANPRRGHAHRRSAAISSHDLSMILKPAGPQMRGSSAPSSPAVFDRVVDFSFPKASEQAETSEATSKPSAEALPANDAEADTKTTETVEEKTPPARPAKVARVGFSDTLEFIPRPLSLVSSDTSSTMTALPGHSLSGSISSIISLTSSREPSLAMASPPRSAADPRPSTAGAVLERAQSPIADEMRRSPHRRNSTPMLNTASLNASADADTPSPSKAPKRWSLFGLEQLTGSSSPTRSRPLSASSAESSSKQISPRLSSDARDAESPSHIAQETETEEEACQKSSGRKAKKTKKKKVRTWAGSILTRKAKPRSSKKHSSRRSQTPTLPGTEVDGNVSEDTIDGIEATTPTAEMPDMEPDPADGDGQAWNTRTFAPSEDDHSYAMIDLDAALGPFNTPLPRNAEWEAAQRASGLSRRPLHSAARLNGFSGPGGHYQHRRTESAPEMPPMNRAGMPRYNSNSTMADVFEEDEEDDAKSPSSSIEPFRDSEAAQDAEVSPTSNATLTKEGRTPSINIRVIPDSALPAPSKAAIAGDDATSLAALSRKGSSLSGKSHVEQKQPSTFFRPEYSAGSLHDSEDMEPKRHFSGADSPGSATPSPRHVLKGKDLALDVSPLHLPTASLAPVSPYSMTHSSSAFPSPRSPMSYEDANRISTAPSSFTEDNFQSLLMGEPGPEVRLSMDIPSLTSSNSTMTRESAYAQTVQNLSQPPVRGERPASFSSPFGRRGSLASIGRLISTSHGERSKLSIEMSLDQDQPEKKAKQSKAKRLSRLMQFWKPKENASSA